MKGVDRISLLLLAIAIVSLVGMAMEIRVMPSAFASICKGPRDAPRTQDAEAPSLPD